MEGRICQELLPCHGYFRPNATHLSKCICPSNITLPTVIKPKGLRAAREEARKPLLRISKEDLPCRHFEKGTCILKKCKFFHDLNLAASIECRLMHNEKECLGGPDCRYNHPWKAGSASAASGLSTAVTATAARTTAELGTAAATPIQGEAMQFECKYTPYYIINNRRIPFYPSKKKESRHGW